MAKYNKIFATVVQEPDYSRSEFDMSVHPYTTIELEDGRQFNLSNGECARNLEVGDTGIASYRLGAWTFKREE